MMPTCREVSELATDFQEGTLPWTRRAGVLLHLAFCSMCRAFLRSLRLTARTLRLVPREDARPAPEAAAALLERFRKRGADEGA